MRKLYFNMSIFIGFLFITSCIEVKFEESQPAGIAKLDKFPVDLMGKYINQDGDTLIIEPTVISLLNRKSKCDRLFEQDSLSESILLKKWHNKYFLNINEDQLWTCVLVEPAKKGDLIVSLIDAESETVLENITRFTDMKTIYTEDQEPLYYLVNPSDKELKALIKNGIFSYQFFFKKIQ